MKEKLINEIVTYIVEEPCHDITQTAKHFGYSRANINKYLALLSNPSSEYYNQYKAMRVKLCLEKLLIESRSRAGSKSRRKSCLTQAETLEARFKNLYLRIPLRTLGKYYHCSHMTVYKAINNLPERVIRAQDEELATLKEAPDFSSFEESDITWKR